MGDVLTITAHGRSYRIIDPGGRVGSKLIHGEPYEKRLLEDVYRRDVGGRVAFDVGAHVGNHALYLAAICGLTVYAFEPHPDSFARLQENIGLNPDLDVRAVNAAAGASEGRARFASQMQLKLGRGDTPVRPIDDLVAPVDVAIVKVDVEGMEPHALEGMVNHLMRCRPVIYAETHTSAAHTAIAKVLEPIGFHSTGSIKMGSVMNVWEAW